MEKMILRLISLIIAIIMLFSLSGCVNQIADDKIKLGDRFVIISGGSMLEANNAYCVYADKETGVIYLYYSNGITALLNSDGTPMLYDFKKNKVINKR
jgi:hypothetical protein